VLPNIARNPRRFKLRAAMHHFAIRSRTALDARSGGGVFFALDKAFRPRAGRLCVGSATS